MTEIWREFSPNYEVSNLGRVRRLAGYRCRATRILALRRDSDGYLMAHLCIDGKRLNGKVHQLVCAAFHGPRPSAAHQVAHSDGCRTNNAASNLRWVTALENAADRESHGRTARGAKNGAYTHPERVLRGERNGMWRIPDATVSMIRESGGSIREIATRFGVSRAQVSKIRAGKARVPVDTLTEEARNAA